MKLIPFTKPYKIKKECRVCHYKNLESFVHLNKQPLANNLLTSLKQYEHKAPLEVMRCNQCNFLQLSVVVDPNILFGKYLYQSSTSEVFRKHFIDLATWAKKNNIVSKGDLVVDIGSNDGILLHPFQELGAKVLGVEPCDDIAAVANEKGINTTNEYFTKNLASLIAEGLGKAKLITATNVFAHVDDVDEILGGVKTLLHEDGLFMIEFPDTEEMLKTGTFDLIYHEHLSYFTRYSIARLLKSRGFYVVGIENVPVHGGSLRVFCTPFKTAYQEIKLDFYQEQVYKPGAFQRLIDNNKEATMGLLQTLLKDKKVILGYGAPAKMTVLTNYYGITNEMIPVILEDAPEKWAKYTPGQHMWVVSGGAYDFDAGIADYIFIFAWNFSQSIMGRLVDSGYKGKFIIPFPLVHTV